MWLYGYTTIVHSITFDSSSSMCGVKFCFKVPSLHISVKSCKSRDFIPKKLLSETFVWISYVFYMH